MKKNNYVQQLRADNPVFIVWKKIPLSMKLLFVFCFSLIPQHFDLTLFISS